MKIVAIDDHLIITDSYVKFFKESGFEDTIFFNHPENCADYVSENRDVDLFLVDFGLPKSVKYNIENGGDLINVLRTFSPKAKFVIITLIDVGVDLYLLQKKAKPDGIWYKGEVSFFNMLEDINRIMQGYSINTPIVQEKFNAISNYEDLIDKYDLEIISSLYKGVQNKELENIIPFSMSNINKRKADLKMLFGVESINNLDFINKLRSLNII
jgi:DNA-binding NarL/FixJ family response regulator